MWECVSGVSECGECGSGVSECGECVSGVSECGECVSGVSECGECVIGKIFACGGPPTGISGEQPPAARCAGAKLRDLVLNLSYELIQKKLFHI